MGLFDLHLDRHAVAVPSGHIRRIESGKLPALDDDVLEDLVQRLADVNIVVGVRRSIVQHELRSPAARCSNSLVHPAPLPFLYPDRLTSREIAAHGKRRIRKIERRLVIDFGIVGHGY